MELVLTTDADEFARRTQDFLTERLERNVLATVLLGILDGAYGGRRPRFAYGVDSGGHVRLAALRTPPWPLLVTELDQALAPRLLETWVESDPELSGVSGLRDSARAVASAWHRLTGDSTECRMRQALHKLYELRDPPRPAAGHLRLPLPDERSLLVSWNEAFGREAGMPVADRAEERVDERVRHDGLLIWDDHGPVSMVGVNVPVGGWIRLGPVYTPPEHRRRGYAGTAVAVTSRRSLEHGARGCLLFTDLANPTSNKIYAEVGYRRAFDWEEHVFLRAPAPER
jgi:predicted GNAT family acetyltransferase